MGMVDEARRLNLAELGAMIRAERDRPEPEVPGPFLFNEPYRPGLGDLEILVDRMITDTGIDPIDVLEAVVDQVHRYR